MKVTAVIASGLAVAFAAPAPNPEAFYDDFDHFPHSFHDIDDFDYHGFHDFHHGFDHGFNYGGYGGWGPCHYDPVYVQNAPESESIKRVKHDNQADPTGKMLPTKSTSEQTYQGWDSSIVQPNKFEKYNNPWCHGYYGYGGYPYHY